uniref:Ig-like domain-containing protein n=1 Tax=Glossina brevipalpis TaxID=37001 RepID=A0A1A9WXF1_9MUSC
MLYASNEYRRATEILQNVTNEGGTITLICSATGVPKPTVQWRRENLKDIVLRTETRERQVSNVEGGKDEATDVVKTVEGEKLVLGNVHRTDMGGYLCIASNGIPPSVSKRFDVHKKKANALNQFKMKEDTKRLCKDRKCKDTLILTLERNLMEIIADYCHCDYIIHSVITASYADFKNEY